MAPTSTNTWQSGFACTVISFDNQPNVVFRTHGDYPETAVEFWRLMSAILAHFCSSWMATGVIGCSCMPFKVTLPSIHPARRHVVFDLVVWTEAARLQKSLQRAVGFKRASTALLSRYISPSWLDINNWPYSLGPCSLLGKCWPGLWWYKGRCESPQSACQAWFSPLPLTTHPSFIFNGLSRDRTSSLSNLPALPTLSSRWTAWQQHIYYCQRRGCFFFRNSL